ncbi:MAG: oxidoreductase [Limnohabitans sp.]|nr:oxidoreductase [Limnohabitans sp.]
MTQGILSLRVNAIRHEAQGILSFEFVDPSSHSLPAFQAGAHIDVHLPNGEVRCYSLCNSSEETHRYVVAVARDAHGRGGSAYMHDTLRVGHTLRIGRPRQHFPLREDATQTVLIAGGIGITPIWSMVQRLQQLGRDWSLHYATRSRAHAAFLAELTALGQAHPGRVHLHFDQEQGLFDLAPLLRNGAKAGTHVYCCGPRPMLASFELATSDWPPEQVHLEYFQAQDVPALVQGLEVELHRAGKTLVVAEGQSVLDAVLDAGVDVAFSCMAGICGSCEVTVLAGEPDHRDSVLSEQQKATNKTMMICCSGAKSARLVLDL